MTRRELDWILASVSDFAKKYAQDDKRVIARINAYSNPRAFKIPVQFLLDDGIVVYLVLDYNDKVEIKEFDRVIEADKNVRIEHGVHKSRSGEPAEFYLDIELTKKLNKHLGVYTKREGDKD